MLTVLRTMVAQYRRAGMAALVLALGLAGGCEGLEPGRSETDPGSDSRPDKRTDWRFPTVSIDDPGRPVQPGLPVELRVKALANASGEHEIDPDWDEVVVTLLKDGKEIQRRQVVLRGRTVLLPAHETDLGRVSFGLLPEGEYGATVAIRIKKGGSKGSSVVTRPIGITVGG